LCCVRITHTVAPTQAVTFKTEINFDKLQNPEHNMLQPHNNSFSCQKLAYLDLIYYFIMSPYPSYLQFNEQKLNFECTVCIWSLENMVTKHVFTEPLITVNAFWIRHNNEPLSIWDISFLCLYLVRFPYFSTYLYTKDLNLSDKKVFQQLTLLEQKALTVIRGSVKKCSVKTFQISYWSVHHFHDN
jgi:hypothetical protein